MKIHNYHPTTGEYLNTTIADESPLEKGEYLVPAFATSLNPPSVKSNEVAVFNNGSWAVVPDYRGQTLYDKTTGAPVLIDVLGDIPANLVKTKSLDSLKSDQISNINLEAQRELELIVAAYPVLEVATWPNQYAEAVAYTANQSAATPTLSAIATASGQTVAEVAATVMVKAAAYTAASGTVIGKRRVLTTRVMAVSPADPNADAAVKAIVW